MKCYFNLIRKSKEQNPLRRVEDVHGSIVVRDCKCVKGTSRRKPSPKCPFYMLNHCTLEMEIKSFVRRAISLFLFPGLSLLCNSFFGELCSGKMLHGAAALSGSSKGFTDSNRAFGKQPG